MKYLPVEVPHVNQLYHLSWASGGCVWRLIEINGDKCKLRTPKTRKEITAKVSDLRHTRAMQHKIEHKTDNYQVHLKCNLQQQSPHP